MRRLGALLAIAGLLAQAVLLMLHRPPTAVPMHVALATHLTRIEVGPSRHHHHAAAPLSPHHGAPSPAAPHCPICLALHLLGGFVPPATAEVAPPSLWAMPARPILAEPAAASRWLVALPQPRGPPRSA
jgi:hypothetical protein